MTTTAPRKKPRWPRCFALWEAATATAAAAVALSCLHGAQAFVPVVPPRLLLLRTPTTGAAAPAAAVGTAPLLRFFGRSGDASQRRLTQLRMSTSPNNNQMSPESYTEKAWDAITRLPQLATRLEAQYIDTEVLVKSLLEDGPGALANRIFFKAGLKVPALEADLDAYITAQPKVPDAQNKVSWCCCVPRRWFCFIMRKGLANCYARGWWGQGCGGRASFGREGWPHHPRWLTISVDMYVCYVGWV